MSTESKDFDHYAIVLADLRAKREQIDQAINAIEALSGSTPSTGTPKAQQPNNSDASGRGAYLGMSIADATIKLLRVRREQMGNSEILAALQAGGMVLNSAEPINTVGAVITRRSKEVGDIVKIGRGIWGLKEWYPGRSFNKPTKGNGGNEATQGPNASEPPLTPDPDAVLD